MAKPTVSTREAVYSRDLRRCVRCGEPGPLTFQHRASDGMGGTPTRPTAAEGVTACLDCNVRFETDLQTEALAHGWKVRRWVRDRGMTAQVPVYYAPERTWHVLIFNARMAISAEQALALMADIYGPEYNEWRKS